MVIQGVQDEDSGPYTCEAMNDGGIRQVTVELTVEGKCVARPVLDAFCNAATY